jgi:hypothetical protein
VSGLLSQALGGRERLADAIPEIPASIQQPPLTVTARQPAGPGLDVRQAPTMDRVISGERVVSANDRAEANDRPRNHRRHGSALPRQDG